MAEKKLNEKKPGEKRAPALRQPDYQGPLIQLIRGQASPKVLGERISDYHERDIAQAFEALGREDREKLYRVLDPGQLSDVFEYLEEDAGRYFQELNVRKKAAVLSGMEADRAAELLRGLDREQRNLLIDLMDDAAKRDIAMIESFDEDEIGSRMTTDFIQIQAGLTVREAMRELIRQSADRDNISKLYVCDQDGVFCGAIDLKDLIRAREGQDLNGIITTSYPYVYAREPVDQCIEGLKDYSEDSIPVLDESNQILGVLTAQDIVELVDDEMGEDYAKLAGLSAEEDLEEPVGESVKKRLPWLVILLGLGLVVSSVVGLFESVVARVTVVVCFQSLILDMAGNVGTQSLAVTIRVLMDERLSPRQKLALVWKEARVGLVNGLILGGVSLAAIGGYLWLLKGSAPGFAFAVSACIGGALLLAMVISSVSGTVIPMAFKKLGVDPAVASGPLITTVNDLVAVVTYYGLVWLFLIEILHLAG